VNKSKARGTAFETAIVNYLHDHGFPFSHRKVLTGRLDTGDIAIGHGVIEAKDCAKIMLSAFVDEAVVEAVNAKASYGAAVIKRRGKNVSESYVVHRLCDWVDIISEYEENVNRREANVKPF